MAHMGEFEPTVLVIPNPLRTELIAKCMPIAVEYLQEDFIGEVVDCHGPGRWAVRITGARVSFGWTRILTKVVDCTFF